MRTTVTIKPEHRNALLSLAAQRGEKGLSAILEEVIESFLRREPQLAAHQKSLSSLGGTLSKKDADELRRKTRELRASWR